MREFFKNWRRKAGCVTLLVACAVMVAWIRSQNASDLLLQETATVPLTLLSVWLLLSKPRQKKKVV